jgi:hypothetical protein
LSAGCACKCTRPASSNQRAISLNIRQWRASSCKVAALLSVHPGFHSVHSSGVNLPRKTTLMVTIKTKKTKHHPLVGDFRVDSSPVDLARGDPPRLTTRTHTHTHTEARFSTRTEVPPALRSFSCSSHSRFQRLYFIGDTFRETIGKSLASLCARHHKAERCF